MNIQGLHSTMPASVAASSANSAAASSTSTTSSSSSSNSAENTFIQLLVTELQSQDPTSPMDPATMVGQMFSMNQLQQLIDINQTLSTALGGASSADSASSNTSQMLPSASTSANPAASTSSAMAAPTNLGTSLLQATTLPTNVAASYAQQLMTGAH